MLLPLLTEDINLKNLPSCAEGSLPSNSKSSWDQHEPSASILCKLRLLLATTWLLLHMQSLLEHPFEAS